MDNQEDFDLVKFEEDLIKDIEDLKTRRELSPEDEKELFNRVMNKVHAARPSYTPPEADVDEKISTG